MTSSRISWSDFPFKFSALARRVLPATLKSPFCRFLVIVFTQRALSAELTWGSSFCFLGAVARRVLSIYSCVLGKESLNDRMMDGDTLNAVAYSRSLRKNLVPANGFNICAVSQVVIQKLIWSKLKFKSKAQIYCDFSTILLLA